MRHEEMMRIADLWIVVGAAIICTGTAHAAKLDLAGATRLAELAFSSESKIPHSEFFVAEYDDDDPMPPDADRFYHLRTQYFLGNTLDGATAFAVDRFNGEVWSNCKPVRFNNLAKLQRKLLGKAAMEGSPAPYRCTHASDQ